MRGGHARVEPARISRVHGANAAGDRLRRHRRRAGRLSLTWSAAICQTSEGSSPVENWGRTMTNKCAAFVCACSAALMAPPRLHAQTAASGSDQIEEVVVTAQKREQNLQKVPISVTAVSGETLEAQGI